MTTFATPLSRRGDTSGAGSTREVAPATAAVESTTVLASRAGAIEPWRGAGSGLSRVTQSLSPPAPGTSLIPLPAPERSPRTNVRVSPVLLELYRLLLQRLACREVPTGGALCHSTLADRARRQTTDAFLGLFDCLTHQLCRPTPLIQFIGVKGGEGTSTLARRFAGVVAEFEDASVLSIERQTVNTSAKTQATGETAHWAEAMTSALALADVGNAGLFACSWEKILETAAGMHEADPVRNGAALIDLLRPAFRMVILDAGPVMRAPQSLNICRYVDAVVLVIDARKTTADAAASAVARIRASGGNLLGTILNRQSRPGLFLRRT
ncbi:hypothetical protein DF3PA_210048 [Candidatus Defluviicoccus seviourii]|uniref:Uncharacterized protein n=1 Tax=Candidatus Defluviicoccus seviourii TaxID=2565273 RepID=A0A564WD95_9PROT|nr:hypothetical protein DF3PA_210048 [Candidatus Defluviicoccus seviourii]